MDRDEAEGIRHAAPATSPVRVRDVFRRLVDRRASRDGDDHFARRRGCRIAALFSTRSLKPRVWVAGAIFAMLPDADVLSFRFGIAYGDVLGHRGFTHSLLFASVVGAIGTLAMFPTARAAVNRATVWQYLFLATASHGALDALTNGGHGVAFFAPLQNSRYFFPFTPIEVSPIGISRFFSRRGAEVLLNEMQWIWLPAALLAGGAWLARRVSDRERVPGR